MTAAAPAWDRFAHWPRLPARAALFALLLAIVASALVPITAEDPTAQRAPPAKTAQALPQATPAERPRDDDLALYDRVIERIRHGENYYDFVVDEHRRQDYPVRPGLAVRLPTLAYIEAWIGEPGQVAASLILLAAVLAAWWRRLGEEPGGREHRPLAIALLLAGASLGLNRYYFVLHELWAGMLLALSFGLHRPGRWGASLAAAALALAIREHALPFVLLIAAMAFWRRDWKEGAAWSLLVAAFFAGLAVHLHLVAEHVLPGDRPSPSWLALRGLSGWLSDFVLASNLRFLPHWLAGPAVVLILLGWAGWKSPAGSFGTLLYLGYGTAFMIAGRPGNFYWGAVIAPALFVALVFTPVALRSLWRSSRADAAG